MDEHIIALNEKVQKERKEKKNAKKKRVRNSLIGFFIITIGAVLVPISFIIGIILLLIGIAFEFSMIRAGIRHDAETIMKANDMMSSKKKRKTWGGMNDRKYF